MVYSTFLRIQGYFCIKNTKKIAKFFSRTEKIGHIYQEMSK